MIRSWRRAPPISALRVAVAAISSIFAAYGCGTGLQPERTLETDDAIVGGEPSSAYPAVGVINVGNESTCSGVLIKPDIVLTAAHCFGSFYRGELGSRPPVWFFVGDPKSTEPIRAERVVIEKRATCPFSGTGHDLAYIVLDSKVEDVKELDVLREPHQPKCQFLSLGYGKTEALQNAKAEGSRPTPPLCATSATRPSNVSVKWSEHAGVPVVERNALSTCALDGLSPTGYVIARTSSGSTCKGDSGSPLIDEDTEQIVGILSGSTIIDGVQCQKDSKALYTPLASHLDFVDEALSQSRVVD